MDLPILTTVAVAEPVVIVLAQAYLFPQGLLILLLLVAVVQRLLTDQILSLAPLLLLVVVQVVVTEPQQQINLELMADQVAAEPRMAVVEALEILHL